MNDMAIAIVPKSDQLNADDLIAGPRTVKITNVVIKGAGEQPVDISFEGDGGKPYKPCKSMRRVMVLLWGADAKKYIGHSMTLYRDESVKWAGAEVGGIRISHMTGIDAPQTMVLTATKGSRKPYTVKPLVIAPPAASSVDTVEKLAAKYDTCTTKEDFDKLETERGDMWAKLGKPEKAQLKSASDAASARVNPTPQEPEAN